MRRSVPAGPLRAFLGRWGVAAAAVAYGVVAWVCRPATPFEQDEVLFLRALDRYDVAKHSPHPPGYPLYVGLGKVARWLVRDPDVALDLVAVIATVATVTATWLLARRLGASRAAATAGAAMLAAIPTFAFHAAVGFSDIPGTALALLAALAMVEALGRPAVLPVAGAAAAAACAVRPQFVMVFLPLGLAALVAAARGRRWRSLAAALASGVGVSLACWLPAVLITGVGRFRQALLDAGRWAAVHEASVRLPRAAIGAVAHQWLVAPWGTASLAAAFWVAVLIGAVGWWSSGRRALVITTAACGGGYLATGVFTMGMPEAMRYVLPALPFLAILAAGVAVAGPAAARRVALGGVAVWCAAAILWLSPLIALRARQPAPVWECLSWVAERENASLTTVVFDAAFGPHAEYILGHRGFHLEQKREGVTYGSDVPGGSVLFVTREPERQGTVLIERNWDLKELKPLSRGFYDRCAVTRAPAGSSAIFSGGIRVAATGWEVAGSGTVSLPQGAPPQVVRVIAGPSTLRLSSTDLPHVTVRQRSEAFVALRGGPEHALRLEAAGGATVGFEGLELFPVEAGALDWLTGGPPDRSLVVPSAGHTHGRMQSEWVTDLLLRNPSEGEPLEVTMHWSRRLQTGGGVVVRTREVGAGATVLLRDVVGEELHSEGSGALHLSAERPFVALWVTYDSRAPRTLADPPFLRPLTGARGTARGSLALTYRTGAQGTRSNAGFFNPGPEPCEVRVEISEREGHAAPRAIVLRLPAWGFELLEGDRLVGQGPATLAGDYDLRFAADRTVQAFVSKVENASNRTHYTFAGEPAAR